MKTAKKIIPLSIVICFIYSCKIDNNYPDSKGTVTEGNNINSHQSIRRIDTSMQTGHDQRVDSAKTANPNYQNR